MPVIVDVQTALPKHYHSQEEIISALSEIWKEKYYNLERLKKIHENTLVTGRYLALPLEEYQNLYGLQKKIDAWQKVALELSEDCVGKIFENNNIQASEISSLISNTVTGMTVPSLEARVMNKFDFSADTKRLPIFGLGCLAGVAGINRACDYLKGHPKEALIFLSVEICGLTLNLKDLSIPNIISTGLFGDGAAAVLMVGDEHPLASQGALKFIDAQSEFFPNTEEVMGWDFTDEGLKIVLNEMVPAIAHEKIPPFVQSFLKKNQVEQSDLGVYMCHPGGPKVLTALEEALDLTKGELKRSWDGLKTYGNMSSVSVLFVIKEVLENREYEGQYGFMLSMGPAFCAEVGLWKGIEK
jgi:alkylresorcinol/alkylpyrone synthase